MYRTYSYNDMPVPVMRNNAEVKKPSVPSDKKPECNEKGNKKPNNGGLLGTLATDDLILIVIALVLLIDDCDDKLLILAIGFIFLSEWL